ncbi:hypothetical protein lerEdw1_002962 [Lerista edwardsae]|nr:hypothetical protein lerEdw1_002962 [Lerista edwardsae]
MRYPTSYANPNALKFALPAERIVAVAEERELFPSLSGSVWKRLWRLLPCKRDLFGSLLAISLASRLACHPRLKWDLSTRQTINPS